MCGSRALLHKHHIIPRYMGGTDEPRNLVEVTVTQHAMFHFCNFQLWGNVEDYVAYRGLSGQISEAEFLAEKFKIFGNLGAQKSKELWENNPELKIEADRKRLESWNKNRDKHITRLREIQVLAVEAAKSPEARKKQKESLTRICHQQGEKNSQYGKIWITDGTAEGSYRIGKDEPIPEGYHKGRVCDNKLTGVYTIITPTGQIFETDNLGEYGIGHNLIPEGIKKVLSGKIESHKNYRFLKGPISAQDPSNLISVGQYKQKQLEDKVQYYTELHRIYRAAGSFNGFCRITGYDKSLPALCFAFRKYVESYEPQSKNQHTP